MTASARPRRLFVGLRPPAELAAELAERSGRIFGAADLARVAAGDLHVTLAFLGNVDELAERHACAALASAIQLLRPLELALGRAGAFPNERRARVVWCSVRDVPAGALHELAERVHLALGRAGIAREPLGAREDWVPHITLARCRRGAKRGIDIAGLAGGLSAILPPQAWNVGEVLLLESVRGAPPGSRYVERGRFPLCG